MFCFRGLPLERCTLNEPSDDDQALASPTESFENIKSIVSF